MRRWQAPQTTKQSFVGARESGAHILCNRRGIGFARDSWVSEQLVQLRAAQHYLWVTIIEQRPDPARVTRAEELLLWTVPNDISEIADDPARRVFAPTLPGPKNQFGICILAGLRAGCGQFPR